MVINKLAIYGFGKYINEDMEFKEGINLVYGENEAGKSTTHHFIKAMLSDTQEVDGYLPWKDPDKFGGSLYCTVNGEERSFEKNFLEESCFSDKEAEPKAISLSTFKLNNFTGDYHVSELKKRLVNKTVTNSESLNISDIKGSIEKDLKKFESEFKETLKAEKEVDKEGFERKLHVFYKELRQLYIQRGKLLSKLPVLEENINAVEQELEEIVNLHHKKAEELIDSNLQVMDEKNLELKSLKLFTGTHIDKYEKYLEHLEALEIIKTKEKKLQIQIEDLKKKISSYDLNSPLNIEDELTESYLEEFEHDLSRIIYLKESKGRLAKEVDERKTEETKKVKAINLEELDKDIKDAFVYEIKSAREDKPKEEKSVDYKSKRTLAAFFSILFLISAVFLVVLAVDSVGILSVAFVTLGIISLFISLYFGYRVLNYLIRISNETYKQSIMNTGGVDKITPEENLLAIFEKYHVESVPELEQFYMSQREKINRKDILTEEISLLESKIEHQEIETEMIQVRLEKKINSWNFKNSFETGVEVISEEFKGLKTSYYDIQFDKQTYDSCVEECKEEVRQMDEIMSLLLTDEFKMFKEYSLQDIHEFKRRTFELENEIESILEENRLLSKTGVDSVEYRRMKELEYVLKEEILRNTLVLQTVIAQISDNEKYVRRTSDKVRVLRQGIAERGHGKKYNDLVKLQGMLKENLGDVKVSLYPMIHKKMNELLFEITNKYKDIEISDGGNISLMNLDEEWIGIDDLSLGTIDQIYFVIGLTMIENIYDDVGEAPLILDDAFVQYDDDRFERVMEIVMNLNRQVIIYTCYEREYEYLMESGIEFNYIELTNERLGEEAHV